MSNKTDEKLNEITNKLGEFLFEISKKEKLNLHEISAVICTVFESVATNCGKMLGDEDLILNLCEVIIKQHEEKKNNEEKK